VNRKVGGEGALSTENKRALARLIARINDVLAQDLPAGGMYERGKLPIELKPDEVEAVLALAPLAVDPQRERWPA
jgi:hypothetical protein